MMEEKSVDFWRKKISSSLVNFSQQEPYFLDILVSNESCDMWLSGKNRKKVFELDMGSLKLKFHQIVAEILGLSILHQKFSI